MNIFCIGRNYVDHINELGNTIPDEPVIFLKPASSIYTPTNPYKIPHFTNDLNYEIELVLKISKEIKNATHVNFMECCNEITVGIDFTARDLQNKLKSKGLPWEKAKAFDNATVLGKFLPIHNIDFSKPIQFSLHKNNQVVQQSTTAYMLHDFNKIIEHISIFFTLHPGDLIFTGTPAGVGITKIGDCFIGFI
ncbi:MAG: fumarylacetoacetate hydrolase family protein, partial [Sediminibacterium sp.]|nr:fumarylacetoacetate hydrolase family protein [Sediminibacterium sp.]